MLHSYNLRILLRNKKFSLFLFLSMLFAFFGCMQIVTNPENSYIYASLLFVSVSIIDVADLRYQRTIDYTQFITINSSFLQRYFSLLFVEITGLKFFSFIFIVSTLLFYGYFSISSILYFITSYLCYTNSVLLLKHLARRYISISVILKNLLGIPFMFFIITINPMMHHYFYDNVYNIKNIVLIFFLLSFLSSYFIVKFLQENKAIYDTNIIEKYNKKYWY